MSAEAEGPSSAGAAPLAPPRDPGVAAAPRGPELVVPEPAVATLEVPAVVSDAGVAASWGAVVAGVNARKRMLGAFLQACRLTDVADTHLVLAMDDLHRAVVDEKENRGIIAAEVSRVFGRPLKVRCVPVAAGAPPAATGEPAPTIDRVIEWFAGEVIDPQARQRERTRG